jgi:hypothetical protein
MKIKMRKTRNHLRTLIIQEYVSHIRIELNHGIRRNPHEGNIQCDINLRTRKEDNMADILIHTYRSFLSHAAAPPVDLKGLGMNSSVVLQHT